jgi:hypothetical protein
MTVFFEDPFWAGVFERTENRKPSVAKVTFGAEPKDYEVLEFINREDVPSADGKTTGSRRRSNELQNYNNVPV